MIVSCDKNDDISTATNSFESNNISYDTPNCYIEFDEFTDNNASFNLFLLNGRMFDNDANVNGSSGDYLFSLNTSNFVFYNIRAIENPSIETPQYPNIQTGINYIGSDNDSVIIHGFSVNPLSPNFDSNGVNYGMPNEGSGVVHEPSPGSTNTITINTYSVDLMAKTGQIDLDYQFLDALENTITGHYEGSFGVFQD